MKRPTLQNKWVAVLRMAFRARKVFGTLEKRAQGCNAHRDHDCACVNGVNQASQ